MSPDKITTLFATAAATFPAIVGQPSDDDLTAMRDVLYPLLLDIPYDDDGTPTGPGGFRHNLIGLIEPATAYAARWGERFPIPPRPPPYPPLPDNATPVVRAREEALHAVRLRDFNSFEAAERAVAKFIRDAVDEIWYRDLRDPRAFYTNVTAAQLLAHLDANCGGLHPAELVNLPTEMLSYYTETEGIPEYIHKLEEAQRKLARASLPMTDAQLLAIASASVLGSGHFARPTDEWEALPPDRKTWAAWKTHYRAAHIARKRQLLAAGKARPPSFGAANAVTSAYTTEDSISSEALSKLDGYLDNLAAAATTEKTTLAQLIENNATLTATVTSLTASVAALSSAYTLLANGHPAPVPAKPTTTRKPSYLAVGGYCWTHGYRVKKGHDSTTCKEKAEGHKDAATRANTMGGSVANKGWDDT